MRAPKRLDTLSMRWDYYLGVRCSTCGRAAGASVSQWAQATGTPERATLQQLTERMYCSACKGKDFAITVEDTGQRFRPAGEACLAQCPPGSVIRIGCDRCGRRGQYRRETLANRYGIWAGMTAIRLELAKCDRVRDMSNPCGASFVAPLPWMP